jgi:hypothetical protein
VTTTTLAESVLRVFTQYEHNEITWDETKAAVMDILNNEGEKS